MTLAFYLGGFTAFAMVGVGLRAWDLTGLCVLGLLAVWWLLRSGR